MGITTSAWAWTARRKSFLLLTSTTFLLAFGPIETIMKKTTVLLLLAATTSSLSAQSWTLVSSANPALATPGFPTGTAPDFYEIAYADQGRGMVRALLSPNLSYGGQWLRLNDVFVPIARQNVEGLLGPNRSGVEANHVFLSISQAYSDVAPDGQIVFGGFAGPTGTSNTTLAAWRSQNGTNAEVLRFGDQGSLGPNLPFGAAWQFGSTGTSWLNLTSIGAGQVLIDSVALSPGGPTRGVIVLHQLTLGNQPCLLQESTLSNLSPNLGDGSVFSGAFNGYLPVVHDQRIYVNASTNTAGSNLREGIWRICDGAPRALALTNTIGNLGPGTSGTGVFDQIRTAPRPLEQNVVFLASFRPSTNSSLSDGIFVNRNNSNQLVAQTFVNSTVGPNYQNSQFTNLDSNNTSFSGAGLHLAFETNARKTDNSNFRGIWRIRPGGNPEPVALEGESGDVAPGPGQSFQRIDRWALFGNGDIVADCIVNNGPSGLYLFPLGRPPRLVLQDGQAITINGNISASVTSYGFPTSGDSSNGASASWSGTDSWAGKDGSILINAMLNVPSGGSGMALIRTQLSDPDRVFRNGFE